MLESPVWTSIFSGVGWVFGPGCRTVFFGGTVSSVSVLNDAQQVKNAKSFEERLLFFSDGGGW